MDGVNAVLKLGEVSERVKREALNAKPWKAWPVSKRKLKFRQGRHH